MAARATSSAYEPHECGKIFEILQVYPVKKGQLAQSMKEQSHSVKQLK